jgi:integrase
MVQELSKLDSKLFNQLYAYLYIEQGHSPKTVDRFKSNWRILFSFLGDRELTRASFNEFIQHLQSQKKANAYINNFIKLARNIDRYCQTVDPNYRPQFTRKSLPERKKEVELLSDREVLDLANLKMDYRVGALNNTMVQVLIRFLAETGARVGEALELTVDDVLAGPYCVRFRAEYTKNGKEYFSPITEEMYTLLRGLAKTDKIFNNLAQSTFRDDLKRRAQRLNIKESKVYPHAFRHYFVTSLLKQGVPIHIVSRLAHHEQVETTNAYYTHVQMQELTDYLVANHPLLKQQETFESIRKRIEEYVKKITSGTNYSLQVESKGNTLKVTIKE